MLRRSFLSITAAIPFIKQSNNEAKLQRIFELADKLLNDHTYRRTKGAVPNLFGCKITVSDELYHDSKITNIRVQWEYKLSNTYWPSIYMKLNEGDKLFEKIEIGHSIDFPRLRREDTKYLQKLFDDKYKVNQLNNEERCVVQKELEDLVGII